MLHCVQIGQLRATLKQLKLGIMFLKPISDYSSPIARYIILLKISMTIRKYYRHKWVHVIINDVKKSPGIVEHVNGTKELIVYFLRS